MLSFGDGDGSLSSLICRAVGSKKKGKAKLGDMATAGKSCLCSMHLSFFL